MLRTNKFFYDNGFTLEIATTPRCDMSCPYCENRKQESYSCPDLDLDTVEEFIDRSFPGKKLTIILNGGEPTLNPKLERFCLNLIKRKAIEIILYMNLQADADLYRRLVVSGINVKATFHWTQRSQEWFRSKFIESGITTKPLVPCSKDNIERLIDIKKHLGEIELVLLENQEFSPLDIAKLAGIDKSILNQYMVQKKSGNKKDTVRRCGSRYIYIDENGDVCQCVFLLQRRILGSVYDKNYTYIDPGEFVCPYGKCFYDI